jgi:hypothetical protein
MGKVYKGFSLYHRAPMIMKTLTVTMLYISEEKEMWMKHTRDKWITGITVSENSLLKMQLKSGILFIRSSIPVLSLIWWYITFQLHERVPAVPS